MEADSLLREVGVSRDVMEKVRKFRQGNQVDEGLKNRMPKPEYIYYGEKVWHQALAALLAGSNLLLTGPKATGKNVLAECLAFVMGRPEWNVSFHVNVDAAYLIGTDTYDGSQVVFRPGPIYACARSGGFGILDEVNMAKNEALAVLHATLDYRRVIDVPGYQKIDVSEATRFIGTMNNGYAGTRDLNEALVSRFAVIEMPVIAASDLKKLIETAYPDIQSEICEQLVTLFYELQKKAAQAEISEQAVDLRGILESLQLIRNGLTMGEALEMCVVNKSFDLYERALIADVIRARMPSELTPALVFNG
ncbi:AAA family ATPase [Pseudoramibacter alactolyticus]